VKIASSDLYVHVEFVIGADLIVFSPSIETNRGFMAVKASLVRTPAPDPSTHTRRNRTRRGGKKDRGKQQPSVDAEAVRYRPAAAPNNVFYQFKPPGLVSKKRSKAAAALTWGFGGSMPRDSGRDSRDGARTPPLPDYCLF
jgi:hypothetical protein